MNKRTAARYQQSPREPLSTTTVAEETRENDRILILEKRICLGGDTVRKIVFPGGLSMYTPLVSVVIPSYNRRESVKEAVRSALEQDYPKIEVVVIDDGSTDGTKEEIPAAFGSKVRYTYQKNAGKSRARNRGVIESRGELVCFLDSDDVLLPGSISARVGCFRGDEKCRVSYGVSVNEDGYKKTDEIISRPGYPSGYIMERYIKGPFFNNNCYMISRKDMLNHGMYREDLANLEDFELFVRLTHKLYFSYCGIVCTLVRNRGQRARHNYERIIAQGTKALDYIFTDPDLALALAGEKARLYGKAYLRLAKANQKLGRHHKFREYFKTARETNRDQRWNIKFWRRWLISWLTGSTERSITPNRSLE
jgi:glycosyltransferase involved in cell wall biosynthesis